MRGTALAGGPEFDRIRAIANALGARAEGLGDDAALVRPGDGELALSVDLSVEGVHFRREWITAEEIGWRATMAALSDLAAMAAEPVGVLVGLAAPAHGGSSADELVAVMTGAGAAAASVGAVVLGGDLSAGPTWTLAVTVVGRAAHPVRRSGASPGDDLVVTGQLGGARLAVMDWRQGGAPPPSARRAFAHPVARCEAALALAGAGATAMIDLSDGLGGDAVHLAAASGVALDIDLSLVPVHPAVLGRHEAGREASVAATTGGEDYELLCTLPAGIDLDSLAGRAGVALTRIGAVRPGSGVRCLFAGEAMDLPGHDHFA